MHSKHLFIYPNTVIKVTSQPVVFFGQSRPSGASYSTGKYLFVDCDTSHACLAAHLLGPVELEQQGRSLHLQWHQKYLPNNKIMILNNWFNVFILRCKLVVKVDLALYIPVALFQSVANICRWLWDNKNWGVLRGKYIGLSLFIFLSVSNKNQDSYR